MDQQAVDAPRIECAVDAHARIGESPTWSEREQAVYWIDIKAPALHRYDPATGDDRQWALPADVGCMALKRDGTGVLLGLRNGLQALEFATGALTLLAPPPFDPALFRFNEGGCDCTGRFWLGTMFDPQPGRHDPAAPPLPGEWHSYTAAGGLVSQPDFAVIPNGLAWDAGFKTLYLSHYEAGDIYTFDFDAAAGRMGQRRLFAHVSREDGRPDGAAMDVAGGYWSALHDGGRLRRYLPDGRIDRDIALPVSSPTMCAFGGKDLDVLYVTSASQGLSQEQLRREPLAGALLRLRPGVRGRALPTFGR